MRQQQFWMRGGGSALAALAALFTTLCCVGFPAMVGFLSALGAGFLLNDRYLEPLLAGTLLLTLLIAGLHLRRHHQPGPFLLSLVAAGSVFFAIYGIGLLPHAAGGDSMADGMTALFTWRPFLAYGAILVLLGAQVWDLCSIAGARRRPCLFPPTPLLLHRKDERKVSDASNWWRCADRDGPSRLSLSPDHYPAAADLTPSRNGPGQFSQPQYRPGVHRSGHLLRGGACAGVLVLVRPETWEP